MVKPIDPFDDPRIEHKTAVLNGNTYHYLLGEPKDELKGTVFLIHGWPDLSMGWRYQVPALLELGLRVVAPDLMGFGGTDAPHVPPNPLRLYGMKHASDNIAELAKQLGVSKIILGGHDWGGIVVWRTAAYYPSLVSHVFSVCSPYTPPRKDYVSTEMLAQMQPQFSYQLHLASPEVEGSIKSKEEIRNFLNAMYGGRGPNREAGFHPEKGVLIQNLPLIGKSPLLNDREMDYYVEQYARNGLHGTVNWYRTRKVNYEEDLSLLDKQTISQPSLFICALKDSVLLPSLASRMGERIPNLSRRDVDASHWALWEKPEDVNKHITEWVSNVVFGGKSKL